jgi:hypothetical protein
MEIKPIVEFINDHLASRPSPIDAEDYPDWNRYLEANGYYGVYIDTSKSTRMEIKGMLAWANDRYGKGHCYWTGSCFWFDREEDALLFALKWI